MTKNIGMRQSRLRQLETAQDKAEAAHARDYFPHHADIALGLHLLSLWKCLAQKWPGTLLRTSSSSKGKKGGGSSGSGRGSSRSSSSSSSSVDLQETVLPACDMAVSLLKTWPPNVARGLTASGSRSIKSGSSSGGSSVGVPDGAVPRTTVATLMFAVSLQLLDSICTELVNDARPLSTSDAKFVKEFQASPAVQHLLLLQVAMSCDLLHKKWQGLSPIKVKGAAAAVSGSRELAAAAAAAEVAPGSNGSRRGSGKQQQYLSVPEHHTAVLDMLLVPADTLQFPPLGDGGLKSTSDHLQASLDTLNGFLAGALGQNDGRGAYQVQGLPKLSVELCAPLHCMLAEAAVLAPNRIALLQYLLMTMQMLQDVYFGVSIIVGVLSFNSAVVLCMPCVLSRYCLHSIHAPALQDHLRLVCFLQNPFLRTTPLLPHAQAKLSPDQPMVQDRLSTAVAGYTGALDACLQLMGPAVLHAYKHGGKEGARAPCASPV